MENGMPFHPNHPNESGFPTIFLAGLLTWTLLSILLGILEAAWLLAREPDEASFVLLSWAALFYGLPGLAGGIAWGTLAGGIRSIRRIAGHPGTRFAFYASSWLGCAILSILGLAIHQGTFFELKGLRFILFFILILAPFSFFVSRLLFRILNRISGLRFFAFVIQPRGVTTVSAVLLFLILVSAFSSKIGSLTDEMKFLLDRPLGNGHDASKDRPNVIVIVLDTVRQDRLSCYGYPMGTTPNLDRLAGKSVLFLNAYSSSCWTPPTHSSLFTGNYPSKTGVLGGIRSFPENNLTLAEILRSEYYVTLGVTANAMISSTFGFGQGFHVYDELYDVESGYKNVAYLLRHSLFYSRLENEYRAQPIVKYLSAVIVRRKASAIFSGFELSATRVNERIYHWLDRIPRDRPYFLFVNYLDAHSPYEPPESLADTHSRSYEGWIRGLEGFELMDALQKVEDELQRGNEEAKVDAAYLSDLYDGEIHFLDRKVGEMLDELRFRGLLDNTLLVITSDHGEHFGEHNRMEHRNSLYEELLRVPLLIFLPGRFPPSMIPQNVSLCDVPVTILDILRIPVSGEVQGRSLVSLMSGGDYDGRVVAEWRDSKTIVEGGWKYILNPSQGTEELYDLSSDPREEVNLFREETDAGVQLIGSLATWLESFEPAVIIEGDVEMDETLRESLRALGYLE